jgi:maltose alpha-D-glucosyltransferase / alpha-amylase
MRTVNRSWRELFAEEGSSVLARDLPRFLGTRRWFAGKGRQIRSATIEETVQVNSGTPPAFFCFINVHYREGASETYVLPLAYETGEAAFQRQSQTPEAVFLRIQSRESGEEGVIYDAMFDEGLANVLLRWIQRASRQKAKDGEIAGTRTTAMRRIAGSEVLRAAILKAEQSNTSINYGDKLLLKLFRRIEPGVNPDYEIGRYLTESGFQHSPRVAGAIEYQRPRKEPITLAILHEFVRKESDAWELTLDSLRDFFDRAATSNEEISPPPITPASLLRLTEEEMPELVRETVGAYVESARIIGQRTAQMHAALAGGRDDSGFTPEPFTPFYQRSLYQSMRNSATNSFALLAERIKSGEELMPEAERVLQLEDEVLQRFRGMVNKGLTSGRVRVHGDYHLGQLLYTGSDFLVTDFEGEPSRSLNERRVKRSALRDVAGMLRSFSYAVHTALMERSERGLPEESTERARKWGQFWQAWTSSVFLRAYLDEARNSNYLKASSEEIEMLLEIYVLEKAVYELGYELNNRPDWLSVPLQGILELLQVEP